jgi:YVTN family beta-propeller protein
VHLLVPHLRFFHLEPRLEKYFALICSVLATCAAIALFVTTSSAEAQRSSGPKAYVGLFGDNAVAVVDTASNQVLSRISVPDGPHGVVITPDDKRVYVSGDGSSTVSVIDTNTDSVVNTIEVGQTPHGLAITPDGSRVLVADFGTDMVSAIDTTTNKIAWRVPVANPHNFAISPDGQTAYVASQKAGSPSLAILNLPSQKQVGSVPLPNVPRALNFSPDGTQLWFTEAGVDEVQVLDPTDNQITTTIPVGASPHHPLFTPDGQLGMVVSQGPGELWLLDPATDTSIDTVKVGDMPHWIATTSDGQAAYVTNEASNDVSVVDLTTATVTATFPVGNAPRKIVIQSAIPAVAPQPTPVPRTAPTQPAAGPTQPAAAPPSAQASVSIAQFAYVPATITISADQSITWTNNDPVAHTSTSDNPSWDSQALSPGASFSTTLTTPGTYPYHCGIHPFMHGTVVVTS